MRTLTWKTQILILVINKTIFARSQPSPTSNQKKKSTRQHGIENNDDNNKNKGNGIDYVGFIVMYIVAWIFLNKKMKKILIHQWNVVTQEHPLDGNVSLLLHFVWNVLLSGFAFFVSCGKMWRDPFFEAVSQFQKMCKLWQGQTTVEMVRIGTVLRMYCTTHVPYQEATGTYVL